LEKVESKVMYISIGKRRKQSSVGVFFILFIYLNMLTFCDTI